MGLAMSFGALCTRTADVHNLELRLMQLSAEKTLKHTYGAGKVSEKTSEMSYELQNLKDQLGDDYTAEEYQQYNSNCESVENEYTALIEEIRDQMNDAETKIDTQIEQLNTRIEAVRAERDEWEKNTQSWAKKCGYFNRSGSS